MGSRNLTDAAGPLARLCVGALLAGGLLAGGLAGCAQGAGEPTPGGSSVSTESSPSPSSSSDSPVSPLPSSPQPIPPTPPASPDTNPAPGLMTLSGQLEEGVEHGCVLLRAGDKLYLLLGGDRNVIRAGNRVVVHGRPAPGMITTCMQGEPFQVSEARLG